MSQPIASSVRRTLGALLLVIVPSSLIAQSPSVEIHQVSINTSALEYAPGISTDGQTLYFTSDRTGGSGAHDIWFATRNGAIAGSFGTPRPLGLQVNSPLNEGSASVAAIGQIFFSSCQREDGRGDCDIYLADVINGQLMNARNLTDVSSEYWDSQPSISADGGTLYFISNRPGALGGPGDTDIWISELEEDGGWSAPRNAGAAINTPEREDSPFIHASGRYLFFATSGRGGRGGLDFVVSRRGPEGWETPANLGAPINTPEDERFIAVSPSLTEAYFASARTTPANRGMLDIFVATGLEGFSAAPLESERPQQTLMLLPNPAADRVDVVLEASATGVVEITIADAEGRIVHRQGPVGDRTSLDLEGLPSGSYMVRAGDRSAPLVVRR